MFENTWHKTFAFLYHRPNPQYWHDLIRYRPNCHIVAAVVGGNRMEKVQFRFYGENGGEFSGIEGKDYDNAVVTEEGIPMYTVPLTELLERYNAPLTIDYMSLDVEGAESLVMEHFPLHKYQINLLTVERPKPSLQHILIKKGMVHVQNLSYWGETLWVNRKVQQQFNWTALREMTLNTECFK